MKKSELRKMIRQELLRQKGKVKNTKFVSAFLKAFNRFSIKGSPQKRLESALFIKQSLDNGYYPTYIGLQNLDKKKLTTIMKSYQIFDKLSSEELSHLQKQTKLQYERVVKSYVTDDNIESSIKYNIDLYNKRQPGVSLLLKTNIKKDIPKLFIFLKGSILKGHMDAKEWKSLNVNEKFVDSKRGQIFGGSFSSTNYYNFEINIMGKSFKVNNIQAGSDYYAGGWN